VNAQKHLKKAEKLLKKCDNFPPDHPGAQSMATVALAHLQAAQVYIYGAKQYITP
jgi:hypothetical protein